MNDTEKTLRVVRQRYANAATNALSGTARGCGCGCNADDDTITGGLYDPGDTSGLPTLALEASLGCGNPIALANLQPGEVVLDLGSGGGLDVLLSARRVAPTGKAYGLDMTDEMLQLARRNQSEAGIDNAEFLKGHIEDIPLPDASVDVVISNCVINLSGNKPAVLAEAFRVLRPGGRLAITDIASRGAIPEVVRKNLELWAGCVAGALDVGEFKKILGNIGFQDIEIEQVREYELDVARARLADAGIDFDAMAPAVAGRLLSVFVRARRP